MMLRVALKTIGRFSSGSRWVLVVLLIAGCRGDDWRDSVFISHLEVTRDPTGYSPLAAEVELRLTRPAQIEVVVPGPADAPGVLRHSFTEMTREATIPVLGLYPDRTNEVTLRLLDEQRMLLDETTFRIRTDPADDRLPSIEVEAAAGDEMAPGMTLVSYYGQEPDGEPTPHMPLIFDTSGELRWYLDFADHPTLGELNYGNGPERLANGNLYFGVRGTDRFVEVDMLGRVVNTWETPGYLFHHQVLEKPDGNFLVTVDEEGAETIEDVVVEVDRATSEIVRTWDLKKSLDYHRRSWPPLRGDLDSDWFHTNGLEYDPTDGTLIVSGRTQGVVKLTADNEVVWILAPHLDWGTSGNGTDLSTKLLQPLDADGRRIVDPDVLEGRTNHPDFEWAWYQHAPKLLADGSLLLFDNGDNRNYSRDVRYSRAVIYEIDEEAMTVRQTWQYGKGRGEDTYSQIVSDVDYLDGSDNVLFSPGRAGPSGATSGRVIEVDYQTRKPVFEATIKAPEAPSSGIVLHRAERLRLYPEG